MFARFLAPPAVRMEMVMLRVRALCFATFFFVGPICFAASCKDRAKNDSGVLTSSSAEVRHVVLLGTNDMHGGIAPSFADDPKGTGGLQTRILPKKRTTKRNVSRAKLLQTGSPSL